MQGDSHQISPRDRAGDMPPQVKLGEPSAAPFPEEEVLARISGRVPPWVEIESRYCLTHMNAPITVEVLARAVGGIGERALELRHRRARLPSPSVIIALLRLIRAIHAMSFEGKSLERVALRFGYGSAWSLRRVIRRYLKLGRVRPTDREAFIVAITAFLVIVTPPYGARMYGARRANDPP